MNERIAWVDTAKGICIILVVMMHSTLGVGETMNGEGWLHTVVAYAKPFRVPDFFLLSGLFLARVIDRDWRTYSDKRIIHFLYFYTLWLLIQSIVKFPQVSDGGSIPTFIGHLAHAFIEPYGTLWFVYALLVFSVVTKALKNLPPLILLSFAAVLEILPIHTDWFFLNEFCDRYIYFVAGYLFCAHIFTIAAWVEENIRSALIALTAWAIINGILAFTPSGNEAFPTLASLPFISLATGTMGAVAILLMAVLLARVPYARFLRSCGENSIAIYLAFFLPMAATRAVLIKTGIITDIGLVSALVTISAIVFPLILERVVRNTPANLLFVRPEWAKLSIRTHTG
jgi:uncharacterized membrane protein YcfT